MDEIHKSGTADIAPASKSIARRPIRITERKGSGLYLESTEAEQLGVLLHECIRVRDAMTRSVSVITPVTEIGEAVRLMKAFDLDALAHSLRWEYAFRHSVRPRHRTGERAYVRSHLPDHDS